jgi:hypothetical protein
MHLDQNSFAMAHTMAQACEFSRSLTDVLLPDYLCHGDRVEPDAAAFTLASVRHVVNSLERYAALACAGARIVALLKDQPWLASLRLTLSRCCCGGEASHGLNAWWIHASRVTVVAGVAAPPHLVVDNDRFDDIGAGHLIENALDDQADLLAVAFCEEGDADDSDVDIDVDVDRAAVADLLAAREPVSGVAAAARLWPALAYLFAIHRRRETAVAAMAPGDPIGNARAAASV